MQLTDGNLEDELKEKFSGAGEVGMPGIVGRMTAAAVVTSFAIGGAEAWEVSRSKGPLPKIDWETVQKRGSESKAPPGKSESKLPPESAEAAEAREQVAQILRQSNFGSSSNLNFDRRVVPYPYSDGASLGQGWDFVANRKTMSSCIVFKTEADLYQEATFKVQESIDVETLDLALNVALGGEAHGSYGPFSAGAESKTTFDSKFHYKSTDQVLVAQTSIINGAVFVSPVGRTPIKFPTPTPAPPPKPQTPDKPEHNPALDNVDLRPGKSASDGSSATGSLQLTPDMEKLARTDAVAFRKKCGDGFVASVVSGADLYVLYHFRDMDRSIKLTTTYHSKAHAGYGSLFGGSASADLTAALTQAINSKKLGIHLVQSGGVITELPIDEETVKKKIAKLPGEARLGPRPIFMVAMPYASLPNFSPPIFGQSVDLRQSILRYQARLVSAYFEYLNIREERLRDAEASAATYFFDERHALRREDINTVGDQLLVELTELAKLLTILESKECAAFILSNNPRNRERDLCKEKLAPHLKNVDFDDFKYWTRLPLPLNAIPNRALEILDQRQAPEPARKYLYSMLLYNHWVERLSDFRCRLFFECMAQKDRKQKFDLIQATFNSKLYVLPGFSGRSRFETGALLEYNNVQFTEIAAERKLNVLPDPIKTVATENNLAFK